jgi:hypothetical protein
MPTRSSAPEASIALRPGSRELAPLASASLESASLDSVSLDSVSLDSVSLEEEEEEEEDSMLTISIRISQLV